MVVDMYPDFTCWLLDTRCLWPGDCIADSAADALLLIGAEERRTVLSKHFAQDARLSLGSALLKRAFIAKTTGIPWDKIRFGRRGHPVHGKPCFVTNDGSPVRDVTFNISHQAGLVVLAGSSVAGVDVGVDIVCVNERDDYEAIDKDGFNGWLDNYRDMFSTEELWDMAYNVDHIQLLDGSSLTPDELGRSDRCCRLNQTLTATRTFADGGTKQVSFSSDLLIDSKLRRFYTFWCYKEAFIKLTGDALLASWLRRLEFKNVRSPTPGTIARCSTHGSWGERISDVEIWLHEKQVEDVQSCMQAFEEHHIIAIMARGVSGNIPPIQKVDLAHDILYLATGNQSSI